MIIIRMSGGLERQLFQYALYMKLTSLGKEVKFDDIDDYRDEKARPIMLALFNIDYPRATWDEINMFLDKSRDIKDRVRRFIFGAKTNVYVEKGFYDSDVIQQDDVYIDGQFMSQKYFADILSQVRKTFKFPDIENLSLPHNSGDDFLLYYSQIINSNAIGVHIRRSDSRHDEEKYKNICTNEYYAGAIDYMLSKEPEAIFFIFSNEPKWIKSFFKEMIMSRVTDDMTKDEINELRKRFVLVEANDEYTAYLDMFLLSKCKHNIISNSTFSWWGAWMNENSDKIIVAPSPWINGEDANDIYTEGMILVNPKGKVVRTVRE